MIKYEYMITQDNLDSWIKLSDSISKDNCSNYKNINNHKKIENKINHVNGDKLFWCFYIIIEGADNYELAKESLFKCENDFKYKSVYKIKENQSELKKAKLKHNDIESELVTSKKINLSVLHALAIAYKKSIIYMNDRIYYDFLYGEDDYYLIEKKGDDIFIHNEDVNNKIKDIRETLLCLDNSKSKIINSISYYTLKDLQDIADRLNIEKTIDGKSLTKAILYTNIVIKIEKLT